MNRLQPPSPDRMTSEQRRVHDLIAAGPRGQVRGPLAIWLHRPALAEKAQALGSYCRYGTSLSPRLSELAILTMAVLWQSPFEWWAHKPMALKAGLEAMIIEALRDGVAPHFADVEAEMVYTTVVELTEKRRLSDATYERALSVLGQDRLVDLVGLCGYYTLISMTLNAFEVPLPPGEVDEFSQQNSK